MSWTALREVIAEASSETPLQLRNLRAPLAVVPQEVRAEVADGLCAIDITVFKDRITTLSRAAPDAKGGIDMGQRMVWPTTIDCHTHIDKGQVWPRSANPTGTFPGAIAASGHDFARHQTPEDVANRAVFMLQSAYAHGTALLRTHVDASPDGFDKRFGVLSEIARDWTGRVDLQLCPFTGQINAPNWINRLAQCSKAAHTPALSFFLQAGPDLDRDLDLIFRSAIAGDFSLDFHADENLNVDSHCLKAVAEAALRHSYERSILVGHCCSLSIQGDAQILRTLDLVSKTQIGIVALPLCNLYLQGRQPHVSPRQRGIAPLKEIRGRGIPVAIASDNVRDAFYAYGDLDVPDLFRDAIRTMQLDHPVGDWPATVTATAADLIGAPDRGRLRVGGPADLILFSARNWSEFASRPAHDRIVMRDGERIETLPPDFADLDTLDGMTP